MSGIKSGVQKVGTGSSPPRPANAFVAYRLHSESDPQPLELTLTVDPLRVAQVFSARFDTHV
jgi:hypothetical protein